jgi:hypothetical protein
MAFSKKRTSSTSTGSRAKKPVRFVKTRSESTRSGATPTKRAVSKPRTTAANSRNTTSGAAVKESPRKKAASRKASTLKSTAQKSTGTRASSRTGRSVSGRTATSRSTASRKPAAAKTLNVAPGTLPSWNDLADSQVIQQNARPEIDHWFGAVSTARFVVIILALATVFTFYVGHVFATQDLLTEVQQLRKEQLALQMSQDKLEGELHHATGPEEIFAAAGELGLSDRVHRGTPIVLTAR